MLHGGNVEAPEVEQLEHVRIGQKVAQVRRVGLASGHLDQMRVTVTGRQLDDTQPVPLMVEAHGLAVDGDDRAEVEAVRQIAFVQMVCHGSDPFHSPAGSALDIGRSDPARNWGRVPKLATFGPNEAANVVRFGRNVA
ncbi:hypothetical protein GCM10011415_17140 [Salipiger pallidus]|uniref:Uncharacterized protein n=1 Tax=Salipiger pallidus TaxID=1775170 RepID=A0A8J3EG19_9RHOB|nr:hypothetical protein GCM10011415_17140 [Salipiger pallidus]